jgi:WD40 repeat protein
MEKYFFSPCNKNLASLTFVTCSEDNTIAMSAVRSLAYREIWNIRNCFDAGGPTMTHVCALGGTNCWVAGTNLGNLRLFQYGHIGPMADFPDMHGSPITGISYTKGLSMIITSDADGLLVFWNTQLEPLFHCY